MRGPLPTTLITAALTITFGLPLAALSADPADAADLASKLEATEQAFAKTMHDRDHSAFVSHLANETIFFGRAGEIRGKEAVAAAWKPFFDGPKAPFSWQPDSVAVLDSGTLGLTSGPVLAPDGSRIGTFNSVWRRQDDGSWKIVFDRGCPACEYPVTDKVD